MRNERLLLCLMLTVSFALSQRHGYRSVSSVAKLTRNCARNPSKPTLIFTKDNPCSPDTNCRYGAICWRSTILTPHRDLISADALHSLKPLAPIESTTCRCIMHCRTYPRRLSNVDAEENMVCGSDGRTYQNECKLRLAACRCQFPITIRWKGSCEKGPWIDPSQNVLIDLEMDGSGSGSLCEEGIVCKYGAICDVDSEEGPCLCKIDCYDTTALTVCGSDGRSYYNKCYLEEAGCQEQRDIAVAYKGSCQERGAAVPLDKKYDKCGRGKCLGQTIDPQCGSNGLSYPNTCSLEVEACEKKLNIYIVHSGHCEVTDEGIQKRTGNPCENVFCLHGACVPDGPGNYECLCNALCSQESLLVQQNSLDILKDFTTHNQLIQLMKKFGVEQEIDQLGLQFSPEVKASPNKAHELAVEQMEPIIESLDHVEEMKRIRVIGNKGRVVYSGEIPLQFYGRTYSDKKKKRNRPKRRHVRSVNSLNYINETVCGSDGVTYRDECQLRVHSCYEKMNVKIEKIGACPYFINPGQANDDDLNYVSTGVLTASTTLSESSTTARETEKNHGQNSSTTRSKVLYTETITTTENHDSYVDKHTTKESEGVINTIDITNPEPLSFVKNYIWIIAIAILAQVILLFLAALLYKNYRKTEAIITTTLQKDENGKSVETVVNI